MDVWFSPNHGTKFLGVGTVFRDSFQAEFEDCFMAEIVKPRENPNFLKNGKIVISVKIRNFSRSRMMKWTSPLKLSREI